MNIEHQYLTALATVAATGVFREGRNGGTYSMFGHQMRHDMRIGFPLLTTKKLSFKSIAVELLWFLRGDTNVKFLHDHGVTIWDEWADENGDLGPVYGAQWRSWPWAGIDPYLARNEGGPLVIDQIANLIANLKEDPFSRRHVVSAWNPTEIKDMALPPCHCLFQFYASPGKYKEGGDEWDVIYLDLQLYQRSGDMFLGVPFNIASYALLLQFIAREVGMVPRYFVHTMGDYHLYANHMEQAKVQLEREPLSLPRVVIGPSVDEKSIFDLAWGDFILDGYHPHSKIAGEISK